MTLENPLGRVLSTPNDAPLGIIDPLQIAGLKLWCRFNSGITITGSGVSQWDDASGNGNHLLQATDANRPTKEGDGSVLFDGITQIMRASFTLVQPAIYFLLVNQVSFAQNSYLYDGFGGDSAILRQSPTGVSGDLVLYAGIALGTNSDSVIGQYGITSALFNGANSLLGFNNKAPLEGNAGAASPNGISLGARGGSTQAANIQVKEVIISSTALDAATIKKIVNYLASVGGLSI